ncbi:hypothetical protein B0H10DRAFT_2215312 [Mycena sp. CBHHK59/15]|nr:hypothetical protein B0H10DRAFT_2215312 [Mycena sp. CBHHK59/15]
MSVPDAACDDPDGQVYGGNDPVDDNNFIPNEDENIHPETDETSTTQSNITPPITPLSTMPPLTNLTDLALHSPSQVIVGTPFSDINSTRFEYPFPDKASTSSSPEPFMNNSPPLNSPTFSSLSASPSSSAIISSSQSQLTLNTPPTLQHFPASFPPPLDLPNYSLTHPKMRTFNPPVPPSLVKKRQRWTLGLGSLGRKLSLRSGNTPSQASTNGPDAEADPRIRRTMSDDRTSGSMSTMEALANPAQNPVGQDDRAAGAKGGELDDVGTYT